MYGSLTVAGTVMKTYMYTAGGLTLRGKYIHMFTRLLLSPSVAQNHTPDYDRCTSVYVLHRALRDMQSKKRPEPVFLNIYGVQELTPRNKFRQPM
jgi:hypothetical protein